MVNLSSTINTKSLHSCSTPNLILQTTHNLPVLISLEFPPSIAHVKIVDLLYSQSFSSVHQGIPGAPCLTFLCPPLRCHIHCPLLKECN